MPPDLPVLPQPVTETDLELARESVRRGVHGIVPALIAFIAVVGFAGAALGTVAGGDDAALLVGLRSMVFALVVGAPAALAFTAVTKRRGLRIGVEQAQQQRLLATEVSRREFVTRLGRALEMADDEPAAYDVIRRAMSTALPDHPVELLLADNSHSHLQRVVAVDAHDGPAPGCPVEAPNRCVAARRAQTQVFGDSEDLDACPLLRLGQHDRCSAVCVPVSIMGTTVGVLHTIGDVGAPPDSAAIEVLRALSNQAGNRLGMLRIMAETQLQASTDGLTGLMNRRSLENRARELRRAGRPFALVVADLDDFKRLNDAHGHDTGDRALRTFAEALRSTLRDDDLACRYGGEEFVMLLPGASVEDGAAAAERVMDAVGPATRSGDVPTFTASFGIAHSSQAEDFDGVVHCADRALFAAKRAGRNRVCVDGRDEAVVVAPPVLSAIDASESA